MTNKTNISVKSGKGSVRVPAVDSHDSANEATDIHRVAGGGLGVLQTHLFPFRPFQTYQSIEQISLTGSYVMRGKRVWNRYWLVLCTCLVVAGCGRGKPQAIIIVPADQDIHVGESIRITIHLSKPPSTDLTYRWYAERGQLEPQETDSLLTTYIAPQNPGRDEIKVEIFRDGDVLTISRVEIEVKGYKVLLEPPELPEPPESPVERALAGLKEHYGDVDTDTTALGNKVTLLDNKPRHIRAMVSKGDKYYTVEVLTHTVQVGSWPVKNNSHELSITIPADPVDLQYTLRVEVEQEQAIFVVRMEEDMVRSRLKEHFGTR